MKTKHENTHEKRPNYNNLFGQQRFYATVQYSAMDDLQPFYCQLAHGKDSGVFHI